MSELNQTWADVVASPVSTVYLDEHDEGVRFLILRGPGSVCAYLGVPLSHPLAGFDYDSLPLQAHGGLTYAGAGRKDSPWAEGWYWYGWDYNHSGDFSTWNEGNPRKSYQSGEEKKWTPQEVKNDSWSTVSDFKALARLAERIAQKEAK